MSSLTATTMEETEVPAMSASTLTNSSNEEASSSTSGSHGRNVRFDNECILIPECSPKSRRPRMGSRTYSVPLWKKGKSAAGDSDASGREEETHVIFKVPVPSFLGKARSTSRGRSEQTRQPLSPCLRTPNSPNTNSEHPQQVPRRPVRRTSLPLPNLVTIPLRPCCPDCVLVTEESLKGGDDWLEKFTRAARRRRSSSLDNASSPTRHVTANGGFAAVTCGASATEGVVSASSRGVFSINVDEVDKRRKSQEFSEDEDGMLWEAGARHHNRSLCSSSSASNDESTSTTKTIVSPTPCKVLPIEEEDEDQLFPLPSPRRSPSGSPAPSPSPGSSTPCLLGPVPKDILGNTRLNSGSHSPSPTGSRTHLVEGSDESGSGGSGTACGGSRKHRSRNGLLTPEGSPSLSDSAAKDLPPTPVPTSSASTTKERPRERHTSTLKSRSKALPPMPLDADSDWEVVSTSKEHEQLPTPQPSPTVSTTKPTPPITIRRQSSTSRLFSHFSHTLPSSPTATSPPASESFNAGSPPASPSLSRSQGSEHMGSPTKRFRVPGPGAFLKEAAEVLKGVSSISNGGASLGM